MKCAYGGVKSKRSRTTKIFAILYLNFRSKWFSNKYTCGTYSYLSNKCDTQNFSAKELSEPIFNQNNVPVLVFSGEACHQNHYSTTHGAYESGHEQAKLVLNILKNSN